MAASVRLTSMLCTAQQAAANLADLAAAAHWLAIRALSANGSRSLCAAAEPRARAVSHGASGPGTYSLRDGQQASHMP